MMAPYDLPQSNYVSDDTKTFPHNTFVYNGAIELSVQYYLCDGI
jgi:hypothetical protein